MIYQKTGAPHTKHRLIYIKAARTADNHLFVSLRASL